MECKYIDWKLPFLSEVADELLQRYTHINSLDMKNVILALPGSRAKRCLETMIIMRVEKKIQKKELAADWFPPVFMTIGALPELFYPLQFPLANSITEQFAWYTALKELLKEDPNAVKHILTTDISDDLIFQLELGKLFSQLHRELASETKNFEDVAKSVQEKGIEEETVRWQALVKLQNIYFRTIDGSGRWDIQMARLVAMKKKECTTDKEVYIIGAADMNLCQKEILRTVSDHIHFFICAPEEMKDYFDDCGCLIPTQWQNVTIPIPDNKIISLATPQEQAIWITEYLLKQQREKPEKTFSWNHYSIGLPDTEVFPFLKRQLLLQGIPFTTGIGMPALRNRVCLLVRLLANYLQQGKYGNLVALLRHPDMGYYLRCHLNLPEDTGWLSLFDQYQNEYLPERAEGIFQRKKEDNDKDTLNFDRITAILTVLNELLAIFDINKKEISDSSPNQLSTNNIEVSPPEPESLGIILHKIPEVQKVLRTEQLPLKQWFNTFSKLFCRIYDETNTDLDDLAQFQIQTGFEAINQCFDALADIPESLAGNFTAIRAFNLFAHELENIIIPQESSGDGVELSGWLDLFLNDSPQIIISGMNEGIIPSSQSGDQFLPDSIRQTLKLTDNNRRFARDAYALLSICHSQYDKGNGSSDLFVLFGRNSLENDSLLPGRFLFASDENTIVRRVCTFFDKETNSSSSLDLRSEEGPKMKSTEVTNVFRPPILRMKGETPTSMQVSEFQSFLECPYRYFLNYHLRLTSMEDNCRELDAAIFGNVIHKLLFWFGRDKNACNMTDSKELADWFTTRLDYWTKENYGNNVSPIVYLQIAQIRTRLTAFAEWQTKWRGLGNQIRYIEYGPKFQPQIMEGETPMSIRGRIDRIDYNPQHNCWFLFDYKTMDMGTSGFKDMEIPNLDPNILGLMRFGIKNPVDLKHRTTIKGARKVGEPSIGHWQWTNLQLPLYRYLFEQICREQKIDTGGNPPILGYIILPKSNRVQGQGAPWMKEDLQEADDTARWVIRTLRSLWSQDIDPFRDIDPNHPEWGKIMARGLKYASSFAAITREGM